MKKFIAPAALILALQIAVVWLCFYLGMIFTSDSGNWVRISGWWPITLLALVVIPSIGGKWLSQLLNMPISWGNCVAICFINVGIGVGLVTLWAFILA